MLFINKLSQCHDDWMKTVGEVATLVTFSQNGQSPTSTAHKKFQNSKFHFHRIYLNVILNMYTKFHDDWMKTVEEVAILVTFSQN